MTDLKTATTNFFDAFRLFLYTDSNDEGMSPEKREKILNEISDLNIDMSHWLDNDHDFSFRIENLNKCLNIIADQDPEKKIPEDSILDKGYDEAKKYPAMELLYSSLELRRSLMETDGDLKDSVYSIIQGRTSILKVINIDIDMNNLKYCFADLIDYMRQIFNEDKIKNNKYVQKLSLNKKQRSSIREIFLKFREIQKFLTTKDSEQFKNQPILCVTNDFFQSPFWKGDTTCIIGNFGPIPEKGLIPSCNPSFWNYAGKPGNTQKLTVTEKIRREELHHHIKSELKKHLEEGNPLTLGTFGMDCIKCGYMFWDENSPHICPYCKIYSALENIHPSLNKYESIFLLDLDIIDYSDAIVKDNCTLVKLNDNQQIENVLFAYPSTTGKKLYDKGELIDYANKTKFIFAGKTCKPPKAMNGIQMTSRFENYLINKCSKSLIKKKIILTEIKRTTGMLLQHHDLGAETLRITLDDFNDLFNFTDQPPKLSDLDVKLILKKLEKKNCLYRGINDYYSENDGIKCSNYLRHPEFSETGMLQDHEKFEVNQLISKRHYSSNDPVRALTDLRHRGKDTNVIDFSEKAHVSLFFACNGKNTKNPSEFLILDRSKMKEIDSLNYPIEEDCILKPEFKGSDNEERAEIQKSQFVYCHKGFLSREEYSDTMENILIDESLNKLFLSFSNFDDDTIYPDLDGFMQNKKNFESYVVFYHNALKKISELENVDLSANDKLNLANEAKEQIEKSIKLAYGIWEKTDILENKLKECELLINKYREIVDN